MELQFGLEIWVLLRRRRQGTNDSILSPWIHKDPIFPKQEEGLPLGRERESGQAEEELFRHRDKPRSAHSTCVLGGPQITS